jgi:phytoene dehydrogenase-like protein
MPTAHRRLDATPERRHPRRSEDPASGTRTGSATELQRQPLLRPTSRLGRAATPAPGASLTSAAPHVGGGVRGAARANAARALSVARRTGRQ